jgi:hypothetical protein
MEADPGEERWNYPVWAYNSDSVRRSPRQVEVKLNLGYIKDSNREYDESPKIHRVKYFHYMLDLNQSGEIVGGRFYRDSSLIAMLWLPLQPKAGRQPGNELGNPHLNVQQILSIWRDSVPEEARQRWVVVDPPREDRQLVVNDPEMLVPVGYSINRVETRLTDSSRPGSDHRQSTVVVDEDWASTPRERALFGTDAPLTDGILPWNATGERSESSPIVIANRPGILVRPTTEDMQQDEQTEEDDWHELDP